VNAELFAVNQLVLLKHDSWPLLIVDASVKYGANKLTTAVSV